MEQKKKKIKFDLVVSLKKQNKVNSHLETWNFKIKIILKDLICIMYIVTYITEECK